MMDETPQYNFKPGWQFTYPPRATHEVFVVTLPDTMKTWLPSQVEQYRAHIAQMLQEQGILLPVVVIPLGATVQIVRSPQE